MHIFVLNNLACISDICFNIIPWKLRVIFARNIVEGNTSFNKFQNHVDRNSGSFNARLATKNLRVWNYMSFHYYLSSISFCHPWLIISFEIDENNIKSAFHKLFCFSPNVTNLLRAFTIKTDWVPSNAAIGFSSPLHYPPLLSNPKTLIWNFMKFNVDFMSFIKKGYVRELASLAPWPTQWWECRRQSVTNMRR